MHTDLQPKIQDMVQALLEELKTTLGENLYAVYLYGAIAFPESRYFGDIDCHVILNHRLSRDEIKKFYDIDTSFAQSFPLCPGLDIYFILLDEARNTSPPRHQIRPEIVDESWALHREHMRAGRCIILYGPDPKEIFPPASWHELKAALHRELEYVRNHLTEYPDYCILNLCRIMYSFQTCDVVVSKIAAAAWAWETFPEWRPYIELAKKSYAKQTTPQERQIMISEIEKLYQFAVQQMAVQNDDATD